MADSAKIEAPDDASEYRASLEANSVTPAMALEQAIRLLAPGASHNAVATQLLEARVSWHAVRSWRRGRRAVPQWVIDALDAKLEAQTRPALEARRLLEQTRPAIVDRGAYGTRALRRWRLSKQKAGG